MSENCLSKSELFKCLHTFNQSLINGKRTTNTTEAYEEVWKIIKSFPEEFQKMTIDQIENFLQLDCFSALIELYIFLCVYLYHQIRFFPQNIQNFYVRQKLFSWRIKKINATEIKYYSYHTVLECDFYVSRKIRYNDLGSISIQFKNQFTKKTKQLSIIHIPSNISDKMYNRINAFDCSLLKYLQVLIYRIKYELLGNNYLNVRKKLISS